MSKDLYSLTYLENPSGYKTAIHRFRGEQSSQPLLLIHGNIENASIFFSKSGKGLAPYLAHQGFDVFVPDLPGKGESDPQVSRSFHHSQYDTIHIDIPSYIEIIRKEYPTEKISLIGHSWGGVLLLAWYAHFGSLEKIASILCFGSKRRVITMNWQRIIFIDIFWNIWGKAASAMFGYMPAKWVMKTADNEPRQFHLDGVRWIYSRQWIDVEKNLNISEALKAKSKPRALFIAGVKDSYLGNPKDIKLLMKESGLEDAKFLLLSKANGNALDYGHIDMLVSKKAKEDHFPIIANWLKSSY